MSKEAMQQAMEALYNMVEDGDVTDKRQALEAITALREALAEQPAQLKPLTDEQCDALMLALDEWARDVDQYEYGLPFYDEELRAQAREIIRTAHGIKENT